MHTAQPVMQLMLLGVIHAKACVMNSECAEGEWCGSPDGGADKCHAGDCKITKSRAHSCYSCSKAYKETYTVTEDCKCLATEEDVQAMGGKCYSGMGGVPENEKTTGAPTIPTTPSTTASSTTLENTPDASSSSSAGVSSLVLLFTLRLFQYA
eukprot:gnl/MRDRNA2_/MRDRNA2_61731_c0_seq1.p1 gnl/MRDRNA2_/MRDRNA2_61731_c0~~gnl/MRDRNA2_/MRDRNA2_61731_c0_seq1.p1  ORF type:complete len:166 (-),score=23.18 gnl/MRDRNA2_/MRDRNA2_61731_c0_seq1:186-644(-)